MENRKLIEVYIDTVKGSIISIKKKVRYTSKTECYCMLNYASRQMYNAINNGIDGVSVCITYDLYYMNEPTYIYEPINL